MDTTPLFNSQQLEYLHDTEFLLTKRKISLQLQQLLAQTEQVLVKYVKEDRHSTIPEHCLVAAGKISRGENYRGLPYLVLDYPRLLKQEDIFSYRTMVWWGNFFSCTLHLQGISMDTYRQNIHTSLLSLHGSLAETYLCTQQSPWEYHYKKENYQLIGDLSKEEISATLEKDFIKVSRKMALKDYRQLPEFALHAFKDFLSLLSGTKS